MPRGSSEDRDREHAAYVRRIRDATRVDKLVSSALDLERSIKSGNADHLEIIPTRELDNMMFTRIRMSADDFTTRKIPKKWEGPKGKYYEVLRAIVAEGTVTVGQIRNSFGNHDASSAIIQAQQQGLITLEGDQDIRSTVVRL